MASSSASAGRQDQISGEAADYGSHAVRASAGLEIVGRLESGAPRCAGGASHRSEGGGGVSPHVLSGSEFLLARVRLLVGRGVEQVDDAVAPLCENLPYFATAPPFLR